MLTAIDDFEGRKYRVEWFSAVPVPEDLRVRQVAGICFTETRLIVLVSGDGASWGLPGGHPEAGESVEETLKREIREEACCEVEAFEYLGYQRCTPEAGGTPDIQVRYACLVRPLVFDPKHEVTLRRIVPESEFLKTLAWGDTPIAAELARLAGESVKRMWKAGDK